MRAANRFLRRHGTTSDASLYTDYSSIANNAHHHSSGFARRELPANAEVQLEIAVRQRRQGNRDGHARMLAFAAEARAEWQSLGGFLP